MIAYHCTNNKKSILKVGAVKPMRMDSVYLFKNKADAENYCKEFGYKDIIEIVIQKGAILRQWKASYGHVIRIKPGLSVPTPTE